MLPTKYHVVLLNLFKLFLGNSALISIIYFQISENRLLQEVQQLWGTCFGSSRDGTLKNYWRIKSIYFLGTFPDLCSSAIETELIDRSIILALFEAEVNRNDDFELFYELTLRKADFSKFEINNDCVRSKLGALILKME